MTFKMQKGTSKLKRILCSITQDVPISCSPGCWQIGRQAIVYARRSSKAQPQQAPFLHEYYKDRLISFIRQAYTQTIAPSFGPHETAETCRQYGVSPANGTRLLCPSYHSLLLQDRKGTIVDTSCMLAQRLSPNVRALITSALS